MLTVPAGIMSLTYSKSIPMKALDPYDSHRAIPRITAMAFWTAANKLFFADSGNKVVRSYDLRSGTLDTNDWFEWTEQEARDVAYISESAHCHQLLG